MATAVFTPAARDEFKRRLQAAGYAVVSVRERGGVLRAFLAGRDDWDRTPLVRANIAQGLPGRPGAAVLIVTGDGGGERQVGVLELPRVICDGAAVRLGGTGTIFRDVRRSSSSGDYWTGVLVTPGAGYPPQYKPGMRLVFHASGVAEVLDPARN